MQHTPPPFQGSTGTDPALHIALGVLAAFVLMLVLYLWYMRERYAMTSELAEEAESDEKDLRIDNIGLSKKAEDLLDVVLEAPMLQNELPGELEVSKATVSNAVSELADRGLIIRKKKANTYLIEPDLEKVESQQR